MVALCLLVAPTTASARPGDTYDAPLQVTIDDLTPGVLPRSGPLIVTGTITNVDLETWHDIRLYPMFGAGPDCTTCPPVMTTEAELATAAASDPETPVGDRYTRDPKVRYDITTLDPGQSVSYLIRIPQSVLKDRFPHPQAGVYWFGVHALGSSPSDNDPTADGRARTFLPSVPASTKDSVDTAVVVPLRGRIAHAAEGELGRTQAWEQALSPDGTLGSALAFGSASGANPVTWLLDPALPDAVRQLARGNPVRAITPNKPNEEPPSSDGASPSETPSGDAGDGGGAAAEVDGATLEPDNPVVTTAESWLRQAQAVLPGGSVALLPYGDPDLAAAATGLPDLYKTAREHPGRVLKDWGVHGTPVVGAPNGYLDEAAITKVDDGATVLLTDQMFPTETFSETPPVGGLIGDRSVVVTSSGAARGGPGPDDAQSPVGLRQRLLSEAAVRVLKAGASRPEPLTLVLPSGIDAAGARSFWDGLGAVPWLHLVDLPTLVGASSVGAGPSSDRQIDPDELSYPDGQHDAQLDPNVLGEAGTLIRSARTLQSILGKDYAIGEELVGEALAGTSYGVRGDSDAGPRLGRTRDWVLEKLDKITIDAPQGVTLSSSSGSFNISVRNTLDQPVTVRIEATTDEGATIRAANPIVLTANSRASVPIEASMRRAGVHNIRLRLTDADGNPIGAEDALPIRSGQVGVVIWVIIGTGGGILFFAIAVRLYRRIRRHGQATEPTEPTEPTQPAEVTP
ncbi:DUF6049 family protein [Nocardioides ginsengisoli]